MLLRLFTFLTWVAFTGAALAAILTPHHTQWIIAAVFLGILGGTSGCIHLMRD